MWGSVIPPALHGDRVRSWTFSSGISTLLHGVWASQCFTLWKVFMVWWVLSSFVFPMFLRQGLGWWRFPLRKLTSFPGCLCVNIRHARTASSSWDLLKCSTRKRTTNWKRTHDLDGSLGSFTMPATFSVPAGWLNASDEFTRWTANYGMIAAVMWTSSSPKG